MCLLIVTPAALIARMKQVMAKIYAIPAGIIKGEHDQEDNKKDQA